MRQIVRAFANPDNPYPAPPPNMLARVVENVYWLSRYLERAENTARIIGVNTNLLLDLPGGIAPGWLPLVDISGNRAEFDVKDNARAKNATWSTS